MPGHKLSVLVPRHVLGQVLVNRSAGKQAAEGAVGQGDRVGLADDVAV